MSFTDQGLNKIRLVSRILRQIIVQYLAVFANIRYSLYPTALSVFISRAGIPRLLHISLLNMLIAQSHFATSKLHYRITYKFLSHASRFRYPSTPDFTFSHAFSSRSYDRARNNFLRFLCFRVSHRPRNTKLEETLAPSHIRTIYVLYVFYHHTNHVCQIYILYVQTINRNKYFPINYNR